MGLAIYGNINKYKLALDASWARNEAISNNISNIDTPGYKRQDVTFEDFFKKALEDSEFTGYRTNEKHLPIGGTDFTNPKIGIIRDNSKTSMRLDGNNVDIENEMAQLAQNDLVYNTLAQKVSGEFRKLQSVISEGRR